MRVAYVCADPGVPVFGAKGCSVHVQEIVRAFREASFDITLVVARQGGAPSDDLAGVRSVEVPIRRDASEAVREREALAANARFMAALHALGPIDLIYERHALWSDAAMRHARQIGVPGVLEVNAPLVDEQRRHRSLVDVEAARLASARAFEAARVIVAVSPAVAEYVRGLTRDLDRVHVIPNAVRPGRFSQVADAAAPERPFTVGFLGSLKPWHGLAVLTEAFARLHAAEPDSRLLVVGDGPERRRLEADLAARHLTRHTTLTGAVPPDDVPELLACMDAAVAPYLPDAGFYFSPLKIFEYMAAGVPVVASDVGQLAEIVGRSERGILCRAGDASAFTAALARLRKDSALRRGLAAAAREYVLAHHTWARVVDRVCELSGITPSVESARGVTPAAARREPAARQEPWAALGR